MLLAVDMCKLASRSLVAANASLGTRDSKQQICKVQCTPLLRVECYNLDGCRPTYPCFAHCAFGDASSMQVHQMRAGKPSQTHSRVPCIQLCSTMSANVTLVADTDAVLAVGVASRHAIICDVGAFTTQSAKHAQVH